ncbi:aminotransferase class I/II-fold pyridoxal phosphate-dependent enzyme [candidate division KSB1 bacterium]
MLYRRMPIELESPEEFGYDKIRYNLAESSVTDAVLSGTDFDLSGIVLAYGDHRGNPELRELIARESSDLVPDSVLVTPGAAAALFAVNTTLLEKGSHMIVAHPNYATNIETPRAIGAEVVFFGLRFEDEWRVEPDRLASMMRPDTKLVSMTSPHNPTGTVMSKDVLEKIIELVEKNRCYLLFDETYRDLCYESPLPVAASLSDRVISVSSMSKSYGFPGIRIGWLICQDQDLMERFLAAKEQMVICNSVLDESIALQVFRQKGKFLNKFRDTTREGLDIVSDWINRENAVEWIKPSGGVVAFVHIARTVDLDIDRFYTVLLEDYKTFVGPGHWFEMDRRFMRIGFGWTNSEDLQQGLDNISKAIRDSRV